MGMRTYLYDYSNRNLGDVTGRRFVRADLSNSLIGPCRGAHFVQCYMNGARFTSPDVRDILTVTATLNCEVWGGVELPPAALDGLLKLFSITKGNDATREKIRAAIDPERLRVYDMIFADLE
jgi:hypothetical protein